MCSVENTYPSKGVVYSYIFSSFLLKILIYQFSYKLLALIHWSAFQSPAGWWPPVWKILSPMWYCIFLSPTWHPFCHGQWQWTLTSSSTHACLLSYSLHLEISWFSLHNPFNTWPQTLPPPSLAGLPHWYLIGGPPCIPVPLQSICNTAICKIL